MKSSGQLFKEARLKKGLIQVEVASKAGIHINTYTRIERGEQEPSFATIKKLAKVLDVKLEDIPAPK